MNSALSIDEVLALQLQEEFDREAAQQLDRRKSDQVSLHGPKRGQTKDGHLLDRSPNSDLSPVDPSLEFSDPNPDIRILFLMFNENYFGSKLSGIEVKWSPRMTSCAGICVYEGHGGLCSVRLSLPLLKLRPRKDLVETLLHEMIHAYLFITNNDRDRDGHGPNFQKHMHRINKATGANITIYHTFHDEVSSYQQHWWRCNGPCQHRKPYFGYVRRAMNRAPSANDFWWAEHKANCGGTYTKIKEPEGYGKRKAEGKNSQEKKSGIDIRAFVGKGQKLPQPKGSKDGGQNFQSIGGSRNHVHGGSSHSKGNSVGKAASEGNLPSTSKHIKAGGIFVPNSSFKKQGSLFSSVASSNSSISASTSNKSPIMKPVNSNATDLVRVKSATKPKKIEDSIRHVSKAQSPGNNKNGKFRTFQGISRGKVLNHGPNIHSTVSPHKDKRNGMFSVNSKIVGRSGVGAMNFLHGQKSHKEVKKKKKRKYIFDELDDDEGLWDLDEETDLKKGSRDEVRGLSEELKDCKVSEEGISNDSSPMKCDQPNSSSTGHESSPDRNSIKHYFPGNGYRLGSGASSSRGSNDNRPSRIGPSISRNPKVPDLKRSFGKAFSSSIIDISDREEKPGISVPVSSKRIKEELSNETFTSSNSTGRREESGCGRSTAASSNQSEDVVTLVSCPVCSTRVSSDSINSHLDQCLIGA